MAIWLVSAAQDLDALALCAAATDQAREIGGTKVTMLLDGRSSAFRSLFDVSDSPYSDGVLFLDPDLRNKGLSWLNVVRCGTSHADRQSEFDTSPSSGA